MFDDLIITNHAKTAQNEAVIHLENKGYICIKEYKVNDRGDGRSGRIDIVAKNNAETIAIEFDNISPRNKSIYKLKNFNADKKYILLRVGNTNKIIDGIFIKSIVRRNDNEPKNIRTNTKV